MLEVDLDYPDELHDLHNNYLLAKKKKEVTRETLFDYQLQIIEDNNFSHGKNKKLLPNLNHKRKYKLHYQNLQLYLNLRLQLKKIHRITQFKQESCLKPYIKNNTELRREAKNKVTQSKGKMLN